MHSYNNTSLAYTMEQTADAPLAKAKEYLSSEERYWLDNDIWAVSSGRFEDRGIDLKGRKRGSIADFSMIPEGTAKIELKYHALWTMTQKVISPVVYAASYKTTVAIIGMLIPAKPDTSLTKLAVTDEELDSMGLPSYRKSIILRILSTIKRLFGTICDNREETEKDEWNAFRIPGARLSATQRRKSVVLRFHSIPEYYRSGVKRYMRRLVIKRSWSHCTEMLRYIRGFFRLFYKHGYEDGFLKKLNRFDIERYLEWNAEEHQRENATYTSKAVSFIREYIDYIQMAEYPEAPEKDIYRLIFADDIPKRERVVDTFEKIKYIPEPVRIQLDANVSAIEPSQMQPLYILLRETGWRGTDILNLRYDTCLENVWSKEEGKYVPYLCGEITKTGIPLLKIPIRDEVAELVEEVKKEAAAKSTEQNNPDKYLFNTYEGLSMGLPYSKAAFVAAVQDMINRKGITDTDGDPYHFKTHSLRHTRATEYAEQGMPIGVIQKLLGHCSLQMSLHYAKVSEDTVYRKWRETEALNTLHLDSTPPGMTESTERDEIRYEYVRKNLDAVRVPFGVCFKPTKLSCKTQLKHCLNCANFCTSRENEAEYREEIRRVGAQIALSKQIGRQDWVEKNQEYLELLISMVERIHNEGVVHKNGGVREEPHA